MTCSLHVMSNMLLVLFVVWAACILAAYNVIAACAVIAACVVVAADAAAIAMLLLGLLSHCLTDLMQF